MKSKRAVSIQNDIAKRAKVKMKVVQKVFAAARDVIASELLSNSSAEIPTLANFKVRNVPACAAKMKLCFGKDS